MKCPRCNGKRCEPDNSGDLVWRACKMCHGKGIVPDNNEYWFCSLPTEEKAKVIANATYSSAMMGAEITALPKEDEVRKWEMWLNQPHREEKHE